ncbi:6-O-methylguanine DNA methyltransferase, DNA binding domain [candidate division SR1 bacterium Aalborg_AAW-1]|nr:6-O-methylguanine DNA methyltransferase, DNA binding domain [candidate division SR1 bacterium Aalborg_AAW-1]
MSQKTEVLTFLQTLPGNKVTTYKALAQKFGTHPRAIATYMRTNKDLDIYPCYKVVANNSGLSGYVLGIDEKRKRLIQDGVSIVDDVVAEECILRRL